MIIANHKILGLGNAATDIVCRVVSDHALNDLGLIKGQCVFLSDEEAQSLFSKISDHEIDYLPGGSAANVVSCFAALGGGAEFVGKLSDDQCGEIFKNSMVDHGIVYNTKAVDDPALVSTQIFTIVTPDGERSFAACYGASHYIAEQDMSAAQISASSILLIDGYMLMSENGPAVIDHSIALAKKHARDVVFMPADLSVIAARPEQTRSIMKASQSVICNLEQAQALSGADDIDAILESFCGQFDYGCVTDGANGVYAFMGDESAAVSNPYQPNEIISTNGAGDNFAGGFLFGLLNEMSIRTASRLGMYCALECLKHEGSRPQQSLQHLLQRAA